MLDLALGFLRDELNSFLAARTGADTIAAKLTRLVDDTGKSIVGVDTLGISLLQIEEDRTFRAQLPTQKLIDGQQVQLQPEIKLNLTVMIAANFTHYETGLKYLALVLMFFQSHTSFTSTKYPALDERIEKLNIEVQSLTFEQLNQVWTFVGGKQLPAVFYKIRLIVIQDAQPDASRTAGIVDHSYGGYAMKIRFRPLFTLSISHEFYTERCTDFRFVYPADTSRWLRNARVVAKEMNGELHVLYEADDDGNPLVPIPGMILRFGLQLLNPYFSNFTELPDTFPRERLRYRNTVSPNALDPVTEIPFSAPVFTHEITDAARPVTITLSDDDGVLQTEEVTEDDGRKSLSFDVRGHPNGMLRVEEEFPDSSNTVSYYLDPELQQLDASAVVEVKVDAGFYEAPPAFEIAFEARTEPLSYYVVATRYTAAEFDLISVTDQGFDEDGRLEIGFEKILPADFTPEEISPSLVSGSGDRVVLFKSEDLLARQERARKRIQLSKNGNVLIANLPQPGADRAKAELIIHLSKP